MEENKFNKVKWYHTKKTLVLAILTVGPFALPLLWFHPHYSRSAKVIWTLLIVGSTVGLGILTGWFLEILMAQLPALQTAS